MIYDFDKWAELTARRVREHPDIYSLAHQFEDIKGANYLNEKMAFAGFMDGPVSVHDNHGIAARSERFETLDEFINKYSDGTKVFLYEVTFFPNIPIYELYDENSGVVAVCNPEVTTHMGNWNIRYGILE